MYEYTRCWFRVSKLSEKIMEFTNPNNLNKILEIGSFEGQSSVFFADNLLNHPDSFLYCVDPFIKSGTVEGITTLFVDDNVKKRFLNNIGKSQQSDKITHFQQTSDDFFNENDTMFNFIYIDGCHNPEYVKRDVNNAFKTLESQGILLIDDYEYGQSRHHIGTPKDVVDEFLKEQEGKYEVIFKGYEIAIKKI